MQKSSVPPGLSLHPKFTLPEATAVNPFGCLLCPLLPYFSVYFRISPFPVYVTIYSFLSFKSYLLTLNCGK